MSLITKNVFSSDPFYVESRGLEVKEPQKKKAKKENKVNDVVNDQIFSDLPKTIQPGFSKTYSYKSFSEQDAIFQIAQLMSSIYAQYLLGRPEKSRDLHYHMTPDSFLSHDKAQDFKKELHELIIKSLTGRHGIFVLDTKMDPEDDFYKLLLKHVSALDDHYFFPIYILLDIFLNKEDQTIEVTWHREC